MPKSKVPSRKADQAGHLREVDQGEESGQPIGRITASQTAPSEPRPTINYILGGRTPQEVPQGGRSGGGIEAAHR